MTARPEIDFDDPRVIALARARQHLAHRSLYYPTYDELTDKEQQDSRIDARPYLAAAIDAGLIPPADIDTAPAAVLWAITRVLEHEFIPRPDPASVITVTIQERKPDGSVNTWDGSAEAAAARITAATLLGHPEPDPTKITREIARDVLAHYGHTGYGHGPGSHAGHMIAAIETADPKKRALLGLTHGPYVEAVRLARDVDGGTEVLQRIARGELPAAPE
ncbi:hypothetical protein ACIP98_21225 [Streptomyces sp. NPDC088354]|uniref:hypothetical protein n=1 Tax=Streptomyces sp. NPDC088354 TaxID=3365856 RepID=UPI00382D5BBF